MDIYKNITTFIVSPKAEMLGGLLGFILFMWMIFCFASVLVEDIRKSDEHNILAVQNFKDSCINEKGRIRHDSQFFGVSLYCMKHNGDETIFSDHYTSDPIMMQFINRTLFGLFTNINN